MESVIKQAEDARNKAVEVARHLYNEYRPMKAEVDRTRRECLGLDTLPDLQEEDGSQIPPGFASLQIFEIFVDLLISLIETGFLKNPNLNGCQKEMILLLLLWLV